MTDVIRDMRMREFQVGNKVVKAENRGNSPLLTIRTVEAIIDGKLYLDRGYAQGQWVRRPERLLIIFT